MLSVRNLRFSYGQTPVLHGLSFEIREGSLVSLLGPNGSGKSTLFKCLLALHMNWEGEVLLQGEDVRDISPGRLARKVAYIPQAHYPAFNYSVLDMVLMGTGARVGAFSAPGAAEKDAAMTALKLMGIEAFAGRGYTKLSGGEQQLVLIARAIAQDARLLLMDEPTASLDFGNQVRVMQRVRALADRGYTIFQATHNPNQSYMFSDQIMAIKAGRLLAYDSPGKVFTAPLIESLYGVCAQVESLQDDCVRICVPRSINKQEVSHHEDPKPSARPAAHPEPAGPGRTG